MDTMELRGTVAVDIFEFEYVQLALGLRRCLVLRLSSLPAAVTVAGSVSLLRLPTADAVTRV